jgi:hypothetical protein
MAGNVFSKEKTGRFFDACCFGYDAEVASLLADASVDVNCVSKHGLSALMIAADKGYAPVVALLLECEKVEVNARRKVSGDTALVFACNGGHQAVVDKFVECERFDVNGVSENRYTALMHYSNCGHGSIVRALLKCERLDLNAANIPGATAIMIAANAGESSIVGALAEAGAILSSDQCEISLHSHAFHSGMASHEPKAATLAMLEKHGIISKYVPHGFQSKYYFQDGEGKYYTRNVKRQTWLNRRELLLALYRVVKWSLTNQVEADARRTLHPSLSDLGKFICHCWFDCAGSGKDMNAAGKQDRAKGLLCRKLELN